MNIEIHGTVNVYGLEPAVLEQLHAGGDPEQLADIGYSISPEAELPEQLSLEDEAERLESLARSAETDARSIQLRAMYLGRVIAKHSGLRRARGLRGFLVNDENEPEDRTTVEDRQLSRYDRTAINLGHACMNCFHVSDCPIYRAPRDESDEESVMRARRATLQRFEKHHPYANNTPANRARMTRKQETLDGFEVRIEENPLAHCVPTRDKNFISEKKRAS